MPSPGSSFCEIPANLVEDEHIIFWEYLENTDNYDQITIYLCIQILEDFIDKNIKEVNQEILGHQRRIKYEDKIGDYPSLKYHFHKANEYEEEFKFEDVKVHHEVIICPKVDFNDLIIKDVD